MPERQCQEIKKPREIKKQRVRRNKETKKTAACCGSESWL
jgi:hypothetical protein